MTGSPGVQDLSQEAGFPRATLSEVLSGITVLQLLSMQCASAVPLIASINHKSTEEPI